MIRSVFNYGFSFSTLCCVGYFSFSSIALLTNSVHSSQMLAAESHFARRPSHQTHDTPKACLNLRAVSLAATLFFLLWSSGRNESDDTRSRDFYLVFPEATSRPHHHAVSLLIFKSGPALLGGVWSEMMSRAVGLWLAVGFNVSAWWQRGLSWNQMWLEAVMGWFKNRLSYRQQTGLPPDWLWSCDLRQPFYAFTV